MGAVRLFSVPRVRETADVVWLSTERAPDFDRVCELYRLASKEVDFPLSSSVLHVGAVNSLF
jgi:hypothetical protein